MKDSITFTNRETKEITKHGMIKYKSGGQVDVTDDMTSSCVGMLHRLLISLENDKNTIILPKSITIVFGDKNDKTKQRKGSIELSLISSDSDNVEDVSDIHLIEQWLYDIKEKHK